MRATAFCNSAIMPPSWCGAAQRGVPQPIINEGLAELTARWTNRYYTAARTR